MSKIYKISALVAITLFLVSCRSSSSGINLEGKNLQKSIFGVKGSHEVKYEILQEQGAIFYYPSDASVSKQTPIVFLEPGWYTNKLDPNEHNSSSMYKTLIEFVVSQGYSLLYAPTKEDSSNASTFIQALSNQRVLEKVDTSKIGIIGHSSGGGHTFYLMKKFSQKGWGENGRFILSLDPWYAFGMEVKDINTLPNNTNIIIQKFSKNQSTDPRITLSEYSWLASIDAKKKDYQVYSGVGHSYPQDYSRFEKVKEKNVTAMIYTLKPLDALMEYTFKNNSIAREIALEVGSDKPIENGLEVIKPKEEYQYSCDYIKRFANYCEILQ
jgi:hypothetical protein